MHPAFRIFVALFMAIWSPVCCCQAALLIRAGDNGGLCENGDTPTVVQPLQNACCSGCRPDDQPSPCEDSESELTEITECFPDNSTQPCESCPSCKGALSTSGLTADAAFKLTQPQLDLFATLCLATWNSGEVLSIVVPTPFLWASDTSAQARTGRLALRWHCALVV